MMTERSCLWMTPFALCPHEIDDYDYDRRPIFRPRPYLQLILSSAVFSHQFQRVHILMLHTATTALSLVDTLAPPSLSSRAQCMVKRCIIAIIEYTRGGLVPTVTYEGFGAEERSGMRRISFPSLRACFRNRSNIFECAHRTGGSRFSVAQ